MNYLYLLYYTDSLKMKGRDMSFLFSVHLLSLLLASVITHSKVIEVSFDIYLHSIYTYITVDQTGHIFGPINTEVDYSWASHFLQIGKSNRLVSDELVDLQYENSTMKGRAFQGDFRIDTRNTSDTISNFTFYRVDKQQNPFPAGAFGFAYKFKDKRLSLIHQLKNQSSIDKTAFGLIFRSERAGTLYYGGLPPLEKDSLIHSQIPITGSDNKWSCELQSVILGNISYSASDVSYLNRNRTYITASRYVIIAPQAFIDFLRSNYVNDELKSGVCVVNYRNSFSCECDHLHKLQPLTFVFSGYGYQIEGAALFFNSDSFICEMVIIPDDNDKNNGDWRLGFSFLKEFSSEFNYEDASIHFFSANKIIKLDTAKLFPFKHNKLLIWTISLSILLIVSLLSLIIFRAVRRRKGKDIKLELITDNIYSSFP